MQAMKLAPVNCQTKAKCCVWQVKISGQTSPWQKGFSKLMILFLKSSFKTETLVLMKPDRYESCALIKQ